MKIMTFNIRAGGGERCGRIIESIQKHDPDTVVLTEFRENKNAHYLRGSLYSLGYRSSAAASVEVKTNTVFIASRQSFVASAFPMELGNHSHRALLAEFSDISVMGVYFAQKKEKARLFDFLNRDGKTLMKENGVVIGDFNTGKYYLDEAQKTFDCADQFEALEKNGFIDSWRSRNLSKKEFSWFSNAGNGFRIDHAFSTSLLDDKIADVFYSHEEREAGISDHSALIVDFVLSSAEDNKV